LPFFLDEKGPKNHGSEDHFEAISGSVAVVSETRAWVAQTPETTAAPLAGWRTEMVFETGLSQEWFIETILYELLLLNPKGMDQTYRR
jgi:hypothetical protein